MFYYNCSSRELEETKRELNDEHQQPLALFTSRGISFLKASSACVDAHQELGWAPAPAPILPPSSDLTGWELGGFAVSVGVYIFYLYTSALDGRTSEKRDIYMYSMSVGWVGGWNGSWDGRVDWSIFFFFFLRSCCACCRPPQRFISKCVCVVRGWPAETRPLSLTCNILKSKVVVPPSSSLFFFFLKFDSLVNYLLMVSSSPNNFLFPPPFFYREKRGEKLLVRRMQIQWSTQSNCIHTHTRKEYIMKLYKEIERRDWSLFFFF